jgi:hypothetical protein
VSGVLEKSSRILIGSKILKKLLMEKSRVRTQYLPSKKVPEQFVVYGILASRPE